MQGVEESTGKRNTYSPDTVINTINNFFLTEGEKNGSV